MMRDLEWLNSLQEEEAFKEFHSCCGSRKWANQMVKSRPFASVEQLTDNARDLWWNLDAADWMEAFRSHPKIGEKKAEVNASQKAQQWSGQEQSGVRNATPQTMRTIAELNQQYEARFGYIFIVCATGKSSEEMLANLRERMENDRGEELRIAAGEQAKITQLRMKKMVSLRT